MASETRKSPKVAILPPKHPPKKTYTSLSVRKPDDSESSTLGVRKSTDSEDATLSHLRKSTDLEETTLSIRKSTDSEPRTLSVRKSTDSEDVFLTETSISQDIPSQQDEGISALREPSSRSSSSSSSCSSSSIPGKRSMVKRNSGGLSESRRSGKCLSSHSSEDAEDISDEDLESFKDPIAVLDRMEVS